MQIYDYVTSVQESEIDRIQAKFTKKRPEDVNLCRELGEIQQLVYYWNCKQRQAENKPSNRHYVSRSVFRGFETFNYYGGILNNNELIGGKRKEFAQIYYYQLTAAANSNIHHMIYQQNFIDQYGELHSHIAATGSYGVLLAGYPFTPGQEGAYYDVSAKGRKNENLITFYVRYFSRLDFSIVCNVNDALAVLQNEPIPFYLFEESADYYVDAATPVFYQQQCKKVNLFETDVFLAPAVQNERRRLIQRDPVWFSPTRLSEYEIDSLPGIEPEALLRARNTLICAWRALPHVHLRCSNTAGFVQLPQSQLQRLFRFLEYTQLINDPRVVMASTLPSMQFLHGAALLQMTLKCGRCGAQKRDFCYFFYYTLQPNEHQPQVLCTACYERQTQQMQAKYIYLKPYAIDRHKAFVITDAFRKSAVFGWYTALKTAAEAGEIHPRQVFDFIIAFKEGERSGITQENLAAASWEAQTRVALANKGIYCGDSAKEAIIAQAVVSGKREFCKGLQELEMYYNYINEIVY